jgi:hypothetical protein
LNDHAFDLAQPDGGLVHIEPWQVLGNDGLRDITLENLLRHRGAWGTELSNAAPQFEAIHIAEQTGILPAPGRKNTVRYPMQRLRLDNWSLPIEVQPRSGGLSPVAPLPLATVRVSSLTPRVRRAAAEVPPRTNARTRSSA